MKSRHNEAILGNVRQLFGAGTLVGMAEGQLLERFLSRRDEAAFELIVARHGPMVLGVCRRILNDPDDMEDAFQATFLVLVRKAHSLRRSDLLGNWLYGVAHRVAVRARANGARRPHARASRSGGRRGGVS
jgi:DNA-directed RNA polymerase specialized sigma24 family protein